MSPKFREMLHQAKEAKEVIEQVVDDVCDVVHDILNVDPYSIPGLKLTLDNLTAHIDMGIMMLG